MRREEASLEDVFLHLVRNVEQTLLSARVEKEQTGVSALRTPPKPIFGDILTIMRKEWREIINATGSPSATRMNVIVVAGLLVFCAVIAALMPPDVILQPGVLIVTMVAYLVVLASVCDSFPGERERHTIETLLASAIPDEALLLGKILASVVYGWAFVLLILVTVLIGANIKNYPAMYPMSTLLAALVMTPLSLILFSTGGLLLVLRLPTVRAAQPRVTLTMLGLFISRSGGQQVHARRVAPSHQRDDEDREQPPRGHRDADRRAGRHQRRRCSSSR